MQLVAMMRNKYKYEKKYQRESRGSSRYFEAGIFVVHMVFAATAKTKITDASTFALSLN